MESFEDKFLALPIDRRVKTAENILAYGLKHLPPLTDLKVVNKLRDGYKSKIEFITRNMYSQLN